MRECQLLAQIIGEEHLEDSAVQDRHRAGQGRGAHGRGGELHDRASHGKGEFHQAVAALCGQHTQGEQRRQHPLLHQQGVGEKEQDQAIKGSPQKVSTTAPNTTLASCYQQRKCRDVACRVSLSEKECSIAVPRTSCQHKHPA